ncbi:MAG: VOC family protein [Sandaracinobacteroides sp.]
MIPLSSPGNQQIVQLAYHVADIDLALTSFHRRFGWGPFLVRRHLQLHDVRYRGAPTTLDISVAHAQAGPVQIELVMQHCDRPSTFRDAFAAGAQGLHHVALFPEDHDAMVAHHVAQGFAVTTELRTAEGRGASYLDARAALGHMVEVYRVNPSLHALYARVAALRDDWDGKSLAIED